MGRQYWPTFSQMRGDECREWLRRSDILAADKAAGFVVSWHEACKAMAGLPRPVKKYGHYQFSREHLDAVLQAAREAAE